MPALPLPDPRLARSLGAARRAAHVACQVPAAFGASRLPDAGDHQHTNLGWDGRSGALLGRDVAGLRAGVQLAPLRWVLVDARGRQVAAMPAAGAGLDDGLAWLRRAAVAAGGEDAPIALGGWPRPSPDAGGAVPNADADALDQLGRWFGMADAVIGRLRAAEPTASEVRVWPHHFDLATLITLDAGPSDGETRTLGVGLSPGDDAIDEPYVSVSPWPYPAARTGPALRLGSWWTDGWFGATLRGSELGDRPDLRMASFIAEAVEACRPVAGA